MERNPLQQMWKKGLYSTLLPKAFPACRRSTCNANLATAIYPERKPRATQASAVARILPVDGRYPAPVPPVTRFHPAGAKWVLSIHIGAVGSRARLPHTERFDLARAWGRPPNGSVCYQHAPRKAQRGEGGSRVAWVSKIVKHP